MQEKQNSNLKEQTLKSPTLCFPFRCSTSLLFHSYPRQAKSSNGEPLGIVAAGFTDQTAVPTSTNIKALKGTKCQYNT